MAADDEGAKAVRIEEMDAGFGGAFKRARDELGVESFGLTVMDLPGDFERYPSHRHDVDGQEEVYVALRGSATIRIEDADDVTLDTETLVRVAPDAKRKVLPGPDGIRLLIIGGIPGQPYRAPEFSEVGAPDDASRMGPPAG